MKTRIFIFLVSLICLAGMLPMASCSQETAPSGPSATITSPDREYIISLEDTARVIIPPDTIAEGTRVSIEEIEETQPYEFNGFRPVRSFDISTSGETEFTNDLTLEFTYDATQLDEELDDSLELAVAYYNETYGAWQESDFEINEADSKVIVKTDHLSLWSLFVKEDKYITSTAPHFAIYFAKDAKAPVIGSALSGDPIYEYAAIVRTGLYNAYEAYNDLGLKLPDLTKVYIDDWGANSDKEAEWGWFSKNIEIPVTYIEEKELHMVSAHELFHAVQNQYLNFGSMAMNRWWMEATADYAAAYIATSYGLTEPLKSNYLDKGINNSETFHTYQTAHFIKYLVDAGLDFKEMFKYVMTTSGNALDNLAAYCASKGKPLPALYEEFAYSVIFESSVNTANNGSAIYTDLVHNQLELDLDKASSLSSEVNAGPNYAATLAGVKITRAKDDEIEIPIMAIEPTSGVNVRYILAEGQGRTDVIEYGILDQKPLDVTVKNGYYIYFLVTNSSPQAGYVTVAVGEETVSQSYKKSWSASFYDDKFLADVNFNMTASQSFTITQEVTSGDTFVLQLEFQKGSKDIIIEVESVVGNLQFKNPDDWGPKRRPTFKEKYWSTSHGQVDGISTKIEFPVDDTQGFKTIGYDVVVEIENSESEDIVYSWGGGATLVMVRVVVMN